MKKLLFFASIFMFSILLAVPPKTITPIDPLVYTKFDIQIKNDDRGNRLYIAVPKGKSKDNLKVLFMLDATAQFPMIMNLISQKYPNLNDFMIVGFGHDGDSAYNTAWRLKNYTPKIKDENLAKHEAYKNAGEAEIYYKSVVEPTIKKIKSEYKIVQSTILGHSFGGLFCLNALFLHTEEFDKFVCASPSLGFGNGAVLPKDLGELENLKNKNIKIILTQSEIEYQNSHINSSENLVEFKDGLELNLEPKTQFAKKFLDKNNTNLNTQNNKSLMQNKNITPLWRNIGNKSPLSIAELANKFPKDKTKYLIFKDKNHGSSVIDALNSALFE